MNVAQAGEVELEEPNWTGRFAEHFASASDDLLIDMREDVAYEATLKDYRRFHFTWLDDGKRKPMDSVCAVMRLAELGIWPAKSIKRHGSELDIGDAHMWIIISQRAWKIEAIESDTLFLDSFGEKKQIESMRSKKWDAYCDKAIEFLHAAYPVL